MCKSDKEKDEIWNFIVSNGIAMEGEVSLVTHINGYNKESLNDIIYQRTGYHDVEQLHDCEPDNYDFSMMSGLEEEEDEEDLNDQLEEN